MEKTYFIYENGQVSPPYTIEDLKHKQLTGETMICEKFGTWKTVREIPELQEIWEWKPDIPPQIAQEQAHASAPGPNVETIPTFSESDKAKGRPFISLSFALAMLCFLFAFCEISCGGQKVASVTGFQFVTGTTIGGSGNEEMGWNEASKIQANFWAIVAFMASIAGLVIYLFTVNPGRGPGIFLGVTGVISLMFLQIHIGEKFSQGNFEGLGIEWQPAYWCALFALIAASVMSYIMFDQWENIPDAQQKQAPPEQEFPPTQYGEPPNQTELAPKNDPMDHAAVDIDLKEAPQVSEIDEKSKKVNNKIFLALIPVMVVGAFFLVRAINKKNHPTESAAKLSEQPSQSETIYLPKESSEGVVSIPQTITARKNINVRSTPSVDGAKMGLIPQLDQVTLVERGPKDFVDGKEDYWYKVIYKGNYGYVFGHYTDLNLEDLSTATLLLENRTFAGTIGKKSFQLFFQTANAGKVEGYNITGDNRRPVTGEIVKLWKETASNGSIYTVYTLTLQEPGDDPWDGTFKIDLWISDTDYHGKGEWAAYNGKLQREIIIRE